MTTVNKNKVQNDKNIEELITALYCRLSVEDIKDEDGKKKKKDKEDESNSISNQKQILLDYCKKHGYTNTMFFVDDGISGTSFDRNDFNRMQRMVEEGKICRIIVKDLSRFVGILENRQYTGCAVNFKTTTVSYKVHTRIINPVEDYQIIPNMQEPIINEDIWLRVQELRKSRRRNTATGRTSLFSGLVYCPDCGSKLHFCASKSLRRDQEFFRCANYKDGRGSCKIHFIRDVVLEKVVLEAVRNLADFVKCHEPVFLYMLARKNDTMRQQERKRLERVIERGTRRISEIDKLIEAAFERNVLGKLEDDRYERMVKNYAQEQRELIAEVQESKVVLQKAEQQVVDLRLLLRTLRELTEVKELTPTLVNSLIERIEIHNNDKSGGHCYVKVDIYFTAAGMIDIPTEEEILAMMEEIRENPQEFRYVA